MIPKIMLIALCLIAVVSISPIYAQTPSIPEWIKSTAEFWVRGDVSDAEFLGALQFLVEEGMLEIPSDEITKDIESEYSGEESFDIDSLRSSSADWIQFHVNTPDEGLVIFVSFHDGATPNTAKSVAADAYGKIKVVDERENILYSGTFTMLEEDFGWYSSLLDPEPRLAYEHTIPLDLVKKSFSSSGMVYLDVETKDNEFSGAKNFHSLPMISTGEKRDLLSKEFLETSTTLNQKITKGNFEVNVKNAGVFTYADEYEWTEDEEYFRIDMSVKNIGNERDNASLRGLAILDDKSRQYEKEYKSTLEIYPSLYPGVVNDGYLLFEKMPDDVKTVRLVFSMDSETWGDPPYQFEFEIPLDSSLTSDNEYNDGYDGVNGPPSISFRTDSKSYSDGDTITITGNIENYDSGISVDIIIRAPNGNIVSVAQVAPNSNGNFESIITTGGSLMKSSGEYTIKIEHGSASSEATFNYVSHEVIIEAAIGSGTPGCEETDECFIPSVARVDVGDVVIFTNPDTDFHTFTSGSLQDGLDGVFDSGIVRPGASYEWIPTTVGEQPYFCIVHPWRTGTIIVS